MKPMFKLIGKLVLILSLCLVSLMLAVNCAQPFTTGDSQATVTLRIIYTPVQPPPAQTESAPRLLLPNIGTVEVETTSGTEIKSYEKNLTASGTNFDLDINLGEPLTIAVNGFDSAKTKLLAQGKLKLTPTADTLKAGLELFLLPWENPDSPFPVASLTNLSVPRPAMPAQTSFSCWVDTSAVQQMEVLVPEKAVGAHVFFQSPGGESYVPIQSIAGNDLLAGITPTPDSKGYLMTIWNPGPAALATGTITCFPANLIFNPWSRGAISASGDAYFNAVTSDSMRNTYATGDILSPASVDFGLGISNYQSVATEEVHPFITKYDAQGNIQSVIRMTPGSAAPAQFMALATDNANNLYAAGGVYHNPSVLDLGNGKTATDPAGNGPAILVVKYDPSGTAQWISSMASAANPSMYSSVAVDSANEFVYAGGRLYSSTSYTLPGGQILTPTAASMNHFLVTQYSATTGAVNWARTVSASSIETLVSGMAANNSGVWAVGYRGNNASITFQSGITLSATGFAGKNALIFRYASNGTMAWAATTTSASVDSNFNAVAIDGSGNSFAAGYTVNSGSVQFGSALVSPTGLINNVLLVKFDTSGTALWAKSVTASMPSVAESQFTSIATDPAGNVIAAGYIWGNTLSYDFGNGAAVTGPNAGKNLVVVKYDNNGNTLWAKTTDSGSLSSFANGVTTTNDGHITVVGRATGYPGSINWGGVPTINAVNSAATLANPILFHF